MKTARVGFVSALILAGSAWAMPAEEFKAISETISKKWGESTKKWPDDMAKAVNEALTDAQVAQFTVDQLWESGEPLAVSERRSAAMARLEELAKPATSEGAGAALGRVIFCDAEKNPADAAAIMAAAVRHPGMPELIKTDDGGMVSAFAFLRGESAVRSAPSLLAFAKLLGPDSNPGVLARAMTLMDPLMEGGDAIAKDREGVRSRLVELLSAAQKAAPDEKAAKRFERPLSYLNGAFMKGALVGHAAPAMTVEWSSDPSITSMADLKGKVVLLDFWATWCGPCIRSFPNIRELMKRYEGFPVAVVGVTSLQGYHMGPEGRVDTKGDAAKEYALMPEFIARKEMTWPVVFTKEACFNPDFGVQGIPHVAIIDAKGVVRFRGLHPGSDGREVYEKVDALLKEAGHKAP